METTLVTPSFPEPETHADPRRALSETAPPRPAKTMSVVRAPAVWLAELDHEAPRETTRALLLVLVASAGAFGAVIGTYRGGLQVLYCAAKVPLLLLGTLIVCAPAFVALASALGTKLPSREVLTIALAACARFALVLAGFAPIVWLLAGWLGYHGVVLALTACCAAAGLAASALLFQGLGRRNGGARLAGLAFVGVFALVGAQTSWLLRPFLVHPSTPNVPFLRHVEGDLFHATRAAVRSANGDFDDEAGEWLGSSGGRTRAPAATPPKTKNPGDRQDCDGREGSCD
jgi:hypothetical protein